MHMRTRKLHLDYLNMQLKVQLILTILDRSSKKVLFYFLKLWVIIIIYKFQFRLLQLLLTFPSPLVSIFLLRALIQSQINRPHRTLYFLEKQNVFFIFKSN